MKPAIIVLPPMGVIGPKTLRKLQRAHGVSEAPAPALARTSRVPSEALFAQKQSEDASREQRGPDEDQWTGEAMSPETRVLRYGQQCDSCGGHAKASISIITRPQEEDGGPLMKAYCEATCHALAFSPSRLASACEPNAPALRVEHTGVSKERL